MVIQIEFPPKPGHIEFTEEGRVRVNVSYLVNVTPKSQYIMYRVINLICPKVTHRRLSTERPVVLTAVPEIGAALVAVAGFTQRLLDHAPARPDHDNVLIKENYMEGETGYGK